MLYRILIFLWLPFLSQAQTIAPNQMGPELITFLQDNYTPTGTLGYSLARDVLYAEIDNVGLDLFGIYTNFKVTLDPNEDPSVSAFMNGQGLNAEHVYPQSKGAGDEPQRSDMHNIFPCKVNVNDARGSCAYADIEDDDTDTWYTLNIISNNIPTTNIDSYSEKDAEDCQFEPREEVKGNIARAIFYFYTIYQDQANAADPNFFHLQKETLLQWHLDDPVDTTETQRNDLIAAEQGNKNPFIVDATLAQRAYFVTNVHNPLAQNDWVRISSNLVTTHLHIFSEKEKGELYILDLTGRVQHQEVLRQEMTLNVENLAVGSYLLQVRSAENIQAFRFVKIE
ncbi:MAG: endonuclease [Bacteroidota bacterium]